MPQKVQNGKLNKIDCCLIGSGLVVKHAAILITLNVSGFSQPEPPGQIDVSQQPTSAALFWAGLVQLLRRGRGRRVVGGGGRQGAVRGDRGRERRVPLETSGTRPLGKGPYLAAWRGTNTILIWRIWGNFLGPARQFPR